MTTAKGVCVETILTTLPAARGVVPGDARLTKEHGAKLEDVKGKSLQEAVLVFLIQPCAG